MKYILVIVALIAAGVIGYTVFNTEQLNENTVAVPTVQQNENNAEVKIEEKKEDKPVTTNPVPTNAVQVKTFTIAEVATHADLTSCYSIINGSVYDLTSWIPKHPGGERAIKSICGKDGTDGFNGKHGGKPQQESILATFKIGTLTR